MALGDRYRAYSAARARLRLLLITAFVAISRIGLAAGYYRWKEREGFRNLKVCSTLRPGIALPDLIREFGPPVNKWTSGGELWVSFRTPTMMAGPISVEVDETTGRVLTLRCYEDGPPTWTVKR